MGCEPRSFTRAALGMSISHANASCKRHSRALGVSSANFSATCGEETFPPAAIDPFVATPGVAVSSVSCNWCCYVYPTITLSCTPCTSASSTSSSVAARSCSASLFPLSTHQSYRVYVHLLLLLLLLPLLSMLLLL